MQAQKSRHFTFFKGTKTSLLSIDGKLDSYLRDRIGVVAKPRTMKYVHGNLVALKRAFFCTAIFKKNIQSFTRHRYCKKPKRKKCAFQIFGNIHDVKLGILLSGKINIIYKIRNWLCFFRTIFCLLTFASFL